MKPPVFYLSSPNTQLLLSACAGMPVLFSCAIYTGCAAKGYQQSFPRILIDSGAFSQMNSKKKICVGAYADWAQQWYGEADAVAGLDDIEGDWRTSLRNYEMMPQAFPTFHDTDPPELLGDLVAMAQERDGWIGLGLKPPRTGKEEFIRRTLRRIPWDLHVHGWALWRYSGVLEFRHRERASFDSTNWFRDAMNLRAHRLCRHLNFAECLEIIVKRYRRMARLHGELQDQ